MFDLTAIGIYAGIILVAFIAIGLILSRLYKRASKEVSFVRTGFGGQKVILNGGALVLPVLHDVIPVNMNTLRLEVHRADDQALITRDRMRVDVLAEFYVRAQPTENAIANAAQTLGYRTMDPDALKELVEGKFVDALRAVAAEMAMIELHEQRVDFVQKVQQVVSEDLLKNGLELESVSLTGMDQTSREYFNPNNAFDAEGLTKLTETIEDRRKRRNEIERETEVDIRRKDLEAEKQTLEVQKEEEYARMAKDREVAVRRAAQEAEIAQEQAEKKKLAAQAEIMAAQETEQAKISSNRVVSEERIAMERMIKEREIEKEKVLETVSVDKSRAIEAAEIEKHKAIQLAEQDRQIAIAEKSKSKSEADTQAAIARAEAVKAEEQVSTVQQKEIAERTKHIELIEASKEAERLAIRVRVEAEAEKDAAEDRAEALRTVAEGEADKHRISAQGRAEAIKLEADAAEKRYAVDAEGKRALNEAENILSSEQIARQVKLELINGLPDIIRESVKPMEQIDAIKIFQVDGLNVAGGAGGEPAAGGGSLSDQVVSSALRYRAQAPLIEGLMKEIGMDGASLSGLTGSLQQEKGTEPGDAE